MEITRQVAMTAFRALSQNLNFENEVNKYAVSRNIKKLKGIVEDTEEFTQEARLKHSFKDKDQCPVKDEKGNMKFTAEKEKEFNAELKKHLAEKIDFTPYQFRSNTEILKLKYFFINSDLEFLLDESLLAEPATENGSTAKLTAVVTAE